MKMLSNNVLVTEIEKETKTAGGIILTDPGNVDKAVQPALVLAVSPAIHAEGEIKQGDEVYLEWPKSMPINVDGKKAAIIDRLYIKAVV